MISHILSFTRNSKKGQAIMEYTVLFLVVGMSMLYAMSFFQSNMEIDLGYQSVNLIEAGKTYL